MGIVVFPAPLRKRYTECAPRSLATLQPHAAAVSLDNRPHDVQADAKAGIGVLVWSANLVEALEYALVMRLGDADAEVTHGYFDPRVISAEADEDGIGLWRIRDGVGKEIDQHLTQAISIPDEHRGGRSLNAQVMRGDGRSRVLHGFA